MRLLFLLRFLALALALWAGGASAQPPSASLPPLGSFTTQQRQEIIAIIREALRTDPSLLRDAITTLQEDEERQKLAGARGAIAELGPALFRDPADPVAGNANGDITIVEFYDVRCPYCRRMVPVMAELLRRDTGIRLVYKDFPILGPASTLGARAMLAAQRQGGYERLYQVLMTGGPTIDDSTLRAAAAKAGLDADRLMREMGAPEVIGRINTNLALGRKLDLQGTPAYIIGDQVLPGAVDMETLVSAVAAARRRTP